MRKTVRRDTGSISPSAPNPVDLRLGKLMQERRKYAGFSRKGLAAKLGITKHDIKLYEAGRSRFGADLLALMRIILKVKIGYFTDPITPIVRKRGVAHHGQ